MFVIDERIERDSIWLADLTLCQVRLQNDSRYPWLVLLPKIANVSEVHELSLEQQQQLIAESSQIADALKKLTGCKKINVANLGNVVSQLHWHVVARFEEDVTWPAPIWGVGQAVPYTEEQLAEWRASKRKALMV